MYQRSTFVKSILSNIFDEDYITFMSNIGRNIDSFVLLVTPQVKKYIVTFFIFSLIDLSWLCFDILYSSIRENVNNILSILLVHNTIRIFVSSFILIVANDDFKLQNKCSTFHRVALHYTILLGVRLIKVTSLALRWFSKYTGTIEVILTDTNRIDLHLTTPQPNESLVLRR